MNRSRQIFATISEKLGITRAEDQKPRKFGTFGGVFTPNVLTILGVIMYLRLGWVVGNAGFLGATIIILLAKSITLCTGLSMASITTNIKIGAGGAYSIISKSLGLEAGGSIGIPFYISQMLSAALYIVGFTAGWLTIFPGHSPLLVSTMSWLVLLGITYISAHFAIKVQYVIIAIIALSILSFILTPSEPVEKVVLIGSFEDANFWHVFAIFFPAVTGIMAGANLSGDLKNPRKSIPVGTLASIGVTLLIYIGLAYVSARFISLSELRENQMAMVSHALWGPAVTAGILAATFSSALGSMLGAPRILQALAEQRTVPFHQFFVKKTKSNEPRNALIFTAIAIEIALLLGSLDLLASLITMFFLITYGMLNLVVFIQQSMRIISFRPTFKTPRFVSFLGASGCAFMMFLINPVFSIIAIVIIIGLYVWLGKRGLEGEGGDIRGGMFLVLAERASRLAGTFPHHQVSWKPDLLLPVDEPNIWAGPLLFIRSITYPAGSIFAFTVSEVHVDKTQAALDELLLPLKSQGILVNSTVIEDNDFLHGARLVIQTLRGGAFRPNILFLTLGSDEQKDMTIKELVRHAAKHRMGTIILRQHPRTAFGMQQTINLWLRDKSPNWNLALLIALQLQLNWEGRLNLVTATPDEKRKKSLYAFLERISDQARLPSMTDFHVITGNFMDTMHSAPRTDINIFGLADDLSFSFMRSAPERTKSSCLFVKDSGWESAFA
ncbi:Na-K-Cl cotransporter [candidate division KSB1 bacterium]|nr:Na-K-Cl cotransporter [candidate division KSB1 bacterium]